MFLQKEISYIEIEGEEDITSEKDNSEHEQYVEEEEEESKEIGQTSLIEEVSFNVKLDEVSDDVIGDSSLPRLISLV